jgi:lipopolysaccharide/colanic/teichoic acid biosynthesis glycosyltransferase
LIIAALVKVTSKGPVFYGHSRFGKNGRIVDVLKFRTMVIDGDEVLAMHLRITRTNYLSGSATTSSSTILALRGREMVAAA